MAAVDAQDQDLKERIGRFQVLIVGRANAGKRTILQKVCNTTEDLEIYGTKGRKIDAAVVKSSIKNMKKFISERASTTKLEELIHAIWYPINNPSRTFQRSEEKFFLECDTGHVPVVVVFTKFEALRPGIWRTLETTNRVIGRRTLKEDFPVYRRTIHEYRCLGSVL